MARRRQVRALPTPREGTMGLVRKVAREAMLDRIAQPTQVTKRNIPKLAAQ